MNPESLRHEFTVVGFIVGFIVGFNEIGWVELPIET